MIELVAEIIKKVLDIAQSGEKDSEARLKRALAALGAKKSGKAAARKIMRS